jgi:glycosyltransferase involved in cell wall biosynthesis
VDYSTDEVTVSHPGPRGQDAQSSSRVSAPIADEPAIETRSDPGRAERSAGLHGSLWGETASTSPMNATPPLYRVGMRGEISGGRIVSVATSKERLGTSHYARKLSAAIGSELLSTEQPMRRLVKTIRTRQPLLCHLQFEYRAFGGAVRTLLVLPRFVSSVSRECAVVVTLHGVVARDNRADRWSRLSFHVFRALVRRTANSASRIVVLSERMRSELATNYGVHNVVVIPMGCDPAPPPNPKPQKPYLLFFGFLRPSKGILELLNAFAAIATEFPDLGLVIAGAPAKQHESAFIEALDNTLASHPFRDRITLRNEFIDYAEKGRLAQGAELVVLPYKDRFVEISGVVHDVASCGAPILCSNVPRFEELMEGVEALHVPPTPEAIAAGIRRVLLDARLRTQLSQGLSQLASRESWDLVGQSHLALYEETLTATDSSHGKRRG